MHSAILSHGELASVPQKHVRWLAKIDQSFLQDRRGRPQHGKEMRIYKRYGARSILTVRRRFSVSYGLLI